MEKHSFSIIDILKPLAGIALAAAMLSVMAVLAHNKLYKESRELEEKFHSSINERVSTAIGLWLEEQVHLVQSFSKDFLLIDYLSSPANMEKRRQVQDFLERNQALLPQFAVINIVYYLPDPAATMPIMIDGQPKHIGDGFFLVDSLKNRSVGMDANAFSYVKAIREGSLGFISEAKYNSLPGLPPIVMIAAPITDEKGRILAALSFGLKLEYFNNRFVRNLMPKMAGILEIIDGNGFFIASGSTARVLNDAALPDAKKILQNIHADQNSAFTLHLQGGEYHIAVNSITTNFDMSGRWWAVLRNPADVNHSNFQDWSEFILFSVILLVLISALIIRHALCAKRLLAFQGAHSLPTGMEIMDCAPYPVLVVHPNGSIRGVNESACLSLGYSGLELLNHPLDKFISAESDILEDPGVTARSQGKCAGIHKRGGRIDYSYVLCMNSAGQYILYLRTDSSPAPRSSLVTETLAQSLREAERLRLEAEKASQSKSEFLSTMSHEIRTPLNAIIGMSHLLLQHDLESAISQYAEKIHTAGQALLGVVNSVLDFSKIEAGKMQLEQAPFELDEVLDRISSIFQQQFAAKKIYLKIELEEGISWRLIGDSLRLGQIITNLVSNAFKFTSQGGITIQVTQEEHNEERCMLRFFIRDTGMGMNEEDLSRLFQSFAQVDASITRKYGGTGLGLVIAKSLVEMMNGKIGVKSTLGQGTEFNFTAGFLLNKEQPSAEDHAAPNPEDSIGYYSGRLRSKKVLLVEDNQVNQEVALELLHGVGIQTSVADNGATAVSMLQSLGHGFDLVFMDLQMPIMDGYEAAKNIRMQQHNQRIPIVAMTAHAMTSERDRCLAVGMNDHLSKPIDVEKLYATLDKWIGEAH